MLAIYAMHFFTLKIAMTFAQAHETSKPIYPDQILQDDEFSIYDPYGEYMRREIDEKIAKNVCENYPLPKWSMHKGECQHRLEILGRASNG